MAATAVLNPHATAYDPLRSPPSGPALAQFGSPMSLPEAAAQHVSPLQGPSATPPALSPKASTSEDWLSAASAKDQKVVVSTPWFPDGVEKGSVQVGTEIEAFARLMMLTPPERALGEALCTEVRSAAERQWPLCTVTPYGSFAVGTSSPQSTIDICVEDCGEIDSAAVYSAFGSLGRVKSLLCETADSAFCQVEVAGATANISLNRSASCLRPAQSVRLVRGWLLQFPAAAAVHALLRQVLAQCCNLDVCSGGLSSYALLAMVICACRRCSDGSDAAELMVEFCKFFGNEFDFAACSVQPASGEPVPKVHTADGISILDPLDEANNLAAGCNRLSSVRMQLQHCYAALQRWTADWREPQSRKGYRGRTPLSGIVSHQKLWARAEAVAMLARQAGAGQPALCPVSDPPPLVGPRYQYTQARLYEIRDAACCPPPEWLAANGDLYVPPPDPVAAEDVCPMPALLPFEDEGEAGHPADPLDTAGGAPAFELFSVREARLRQSTPPDQVLPRGTRRSPTGRDLGLTDSDAGPAHGIDSRGSLTSGELDAQDDIFGDIDAALANDLHVT